MTTPSVTDSPENPQRRPRLSLIGFSLCVIAFILLFVPTVGPLIAFFCAGTGFWLCVPRAIRNRRNKIRKDNITNFGFILCLIVGGIAFTMVLSNLGVDLDSEPTATPNEQRMLEDLDLTLSAFGMSKSKSNDIPNACRAWSSVGYTDPPTWNAQTKQSISERNRVVIGILALYIAPTKFRSYCQGQ